MPLLLNTTLYISILKSAIFPKDVASVSFSYINYNDYVDHWMMKQLLS